MNAAWETRGDDAVCKATLVGETFLFKGLLAEAWLWTLLRVPRSYHEIRLAWKRIPRARFSQNFGDFCGIKSGFVLWWLSGYMGDTSSNKTRTTYIS